MPVRRFQASRSSRSAESPPNSAGMLPLRLMLSRLRLVTRFGARETVMPVQSVIGVVALQLSVAAPRKVSLAASSTAQSATRPGWSAWLGTTVPFSQGGAADAGWGPRPEARRIVATSAATSSSSTVEAAIRFHLGVAVRWPAPSARRIAMRARTARVTMCTAPPLPRPPPGMECTCLDRLMTFACWNWGTLSPGGCAGCCRWRWAVDKRGSGSAREPPRSWGSVREATHRRCGCSEVLGSAEPGED